MELRALYLVIAIPALCWSLWSFAMVESYGQCIAVFDHEMKQALQTGKMATANVTDSEPCRRVDAQAKVGRAVVTGLAGTH